MDLFSQAFEHHNRLQEHSPNLDSLDKLVTNPFIIFLVVATFLLSAEQYVGSPVHCAVNNIQANDVQMTNFILDVCMMNTSRYVPRDPQTKNFTYSLTDEKNSRIIAYYPWLPFILIISIVFYILPVAFYKLAQRSIPVNIVTLVKTAENYSITADEDTQMKTVRKIVNIINNYIGQQKGNQFTMLFFAFKSLLFICHLAAIFFLCTVFGRDYFFFGPNFLYNLIFKGISESSIFPFDVFCDSNTLSQTQSVYNQRSTHCFLTTNIFSVFIFCIFNIMQWFGVLGSLLNLIVLAFNITPSGREKFLNKYTQGVNDIRKVKDALDTLHCDGIIILSLIAANSNEMAVSAVINHLCLVNERARFVPIDDSETNKEE